MKKVLFYGAVLIGIYIVGVKATGAGTLLTDTANAGSKLVATFQGR